METWKSIPGFSGYEVSTEGRVKSLYFRRSKTLNPRLLKPSVLSNGRRGIWLHQGGKSYSFLVYQLVALTFIGPAPEGTEICHNNGDRKDDRLANLRYDTRAENYKDTCVHGRRKLSPEDVDKIKTEYKTGGTSQNSLAEKYGVSQSHIGRVVRGKHWNWLGERNGYAG